MNTNFIQQLMGEGYSVACATCSKLHANRSAGLPGCRTTAGSCGDVLDGMGLPQYEGPLDLTARCYICGVEADEQVSSSGQRRLGVCKEHLRWLTSQRSPNLVVVHRSREALKFSKRRSLAEWLSKLPPAQ